MVARGAATPGRRDRRAPAVRASAPGEYVPERGHIVRLDFDPQAGREQARRRPAVVLSPASYNGRTSRALFCPVTSQINGYPFEAALPADLPVNGVVLADQLRSLDWRARNVAYLGALPEPSLADVIAHARALLA